MTKITPERRLSVASFGYSTPRAPSTTGSRLALNDRESPWTSIWISIVMQVVVGIQISIYYMSMWPYLSGLDRTASLKAVGWVVASCSLGCSIANPLFGAWNQKNLSVTYPTIVGLLLAAAGQCLYGLIPIFESNRMWIMVLARFITGVGAGCLSVLRAYLSMASTQPDRLRAISFGAGGFVLGVSIGPILQACFTPIKEGITIGPLLLNMYTVPAFAMVLLSILSAVFMFIFFKEEYAGLADQEDEKEPVNIPKFDIIPALICMYWWMVVNMISTNVEVMSTPLSTAMYDWKDSESVTYNAILQVFACLISVGVNFLIGFTRIGKIEMRHQVFFGFFIFILYHLANYPWPFYSGPLNYIPEGNTTAEIGGCARSYVWCATSVRVPMLLYIVSFIICYGIAFPFIGSPTGTLFSEILGPRKQGAMQGLYSFCGSAAQFLAPIIATSLFERSGYQYVMVTQLATLTVATTLLFVFYKRIVPLKFDATSR